MARSRKEKRTSIASWKGRTRVAGRPKPFERVSVDRGWWRLGHSRGTDGSLNGKPGWVRGSEASARGVRDMRTIFGEEQRDLDAGIYNYDRHPQHQIPLSSVVERVTSIISCLPGVAMTRSVVQIG
jgi:hypothetical protein